VSSAIFIQKTVAAGRQEEASQPSEPISKLIVRARVNAGRMVNWLDF
jgi:hypothetical protein